MHNGNRITGRGLTGRFMQPSPQERRRSRGKGRARGEENGDGEAKAVSILAARWTFPKNPNYRKVLRTVAPESRLAGEQGMPFLSEFFPPRSLVYLFFFCPFSRA